MAVRVWTPVHYYWKHRPYTVKGSYGAVDQKPDDITAVGITGSVSLRGSGPLRIEDLRARPSLNPDGSAEVEVTLRLDRPPEGEARVELSLKPRNFDGRVRLGAETWLRARDAPDGRTLSYRFHVEDPQLWWTWDHGKPNLYTLVARVLVDGRVSDQRAQPVGIRTIEKVGWVFYLNGKRLFVRGTNAYYLELFLSEMTPEKYDRDLRLIRDMNVNMLRLHCHFANPILYYRTDESGDPRLAGLPRGLVPARPGVRPPGRGPLRPARPDGAAAPLGRAVGNERRGGPRELPRPHEAPRPPALRSRPGAARGPPLDGALRRRPRLRGLVRRDDLGVHEERGAVHLGAGRDRAPRTSTRC